MGLEVIELVMRLETAFGVSLGEPQPTDFDTVGSLFDFVMTQVPPPHNSSTGGPCSGPLWERYLDVVEETTGLSRNELRPETRFLRDLGFG